MFAHVESLELGPFGGELVQQHRELGLALDDLPPQLTPATHNFLGLLLGPIALLGCLDEASGAGWGSGSSLI